MKNDKSELDEFETRLKEIEARLEQFDSLLNKLSGVLMVGKWLLGISAGLIFDYLKRKFFGVPT